MAPVMPYASGFEAKHQLCFHSHKNEDKGLQYEKCSEGICGLVDRTEEEQMINDAHPEPEERQNEVDTPAKVYPALEGQANCD